MFAGGGFGVACQHHQREQLGVEPGDFLAGFFVEVFLFVTKKLEPVFFGGVDAGQVGLAPGLVVVGAVFGFADRIKQQLRCFAEYQGVFHGLGEFAQQFGGFLAGRGFQRFFAAEDVGQPLFFLHW